MAVCPGNTVESLPSTSENLQNKEVCSSCLCLREDLIDMPLLNSAHNYRTLRRLSKINKSQPWPPWRLQPSTRSTRVSKLTTNMKAIKVHLGNNEGRRGGADSTSREREQDFIEEVTCRLEVEDLGAQRSKGLRNGVEDLANADN